LGFGTLVYSYGMQSLNKETTGGLLVMEKEFIEKITDWWNELPEVVQESILAGIEDIKKGDVLHTNR